MDDASFVIDNAYDLLCVRGPYVNACPTGHWLCHMPSSESHSDISFWAMGPNRIPSVTALCRSLFKCMKYREDASSNNMRIYKYDHPKLYTALRELALELQSST